MKKVLIGTAIVAFTAWISVGHIGHSGRAVPQPPPDLVAIFGDSCRCLQVADQFGTVSRSAFDESGHRIGSQVGSYDPGAPYKIRVETTYLVPDAEHPFGQAFDGAGDPTPLHLR